ncbi:ComEA family DNA-binding protein [Candidatus Bipolaricaulota bacterium]
MNRLEYLDMQEETGKQKAGGWDLRPNAQTRGLTLLLGAALLAAGLVQFIARLPEPVRPYRRAFVFEDVQVIVPTVVVRGPVNVNTATVDDLVRLSGIGDVLAARIIAYRKEHGPFTSLDDLDRVSGIGPATIDGFRDQAAVVPPDQ